MIFIHLFGFSERMIRKYKATKTNDAALFPSMTNELNMSWSYPNEIDLFFVCTQGFSYLTSVLVNGSILNGGYDIDAGMPDFLLKPQI